MSHSTVLWVDLRRHRSDTASAALRTQLARAGPFDLLPRAATGLAESLQHANDHRPLIVDLDYPSERELDIVRRCKLAAPQRPIIVLLEQQSARLNLWAGRLRLWNVVTKPCDARGLAACIRQAAQLVATRGADAFCEPICVHAHDCVPPGIVNEKSTGSTAAAIDYIDAHYGQDIKLATLAALSSAL